MAQVSTGRPIHVKIKTPKQKKLSFKGLVINFTNSAITVQDRKNMALVRTFSFDQELTRKVESRRMEPGSKVTVVYLKGTDTAVKLKGRLIKEDEDFPIVHRRK